MTLRRDPRAELEHRRKRETPTPLAPAPEQPRLRRDPRAERTQRRAGAAPPQPAPAASVAPASVAVTVRIIESPACIILAIPDLEDGRLTAHDHDLLGAARQLADALGGAVVALICLAPAAPIEDFAAVGVDRLLRADDAAFAGYAPEAKAAAALVAIERLKPRHVLLPDSPIGGGDLARRLAVRLGVRLAANVQRLAADEIACRSDGGRSDILRRPPLVIAVAPEAAEPATATRHEARALDPVAITVAPRVVDGGLAAVDPNAVPLKEADFIVSAGNGVTDWDAFHAVAGALCGAEGGSRVVCDAGLLPRGRQVGASGSLVEPRCYLAFGIAGAPQHLQGIARCERVVAVNTDLHADMVKRADLAIIADAQAVMPALARLARQRRG
jgi:N,N-dimethylglycine/sarcosine catabolism electron transfer flavoprotein subunit alpha